MGCCSGWGAGVPARPASPQPWAAAPKGCRCRTEASCAVGSLDPWRAAVGQGEGCREHGETSPLSRGTRPSTRVCGTLLPASPLREQRFPQSRECGGSRARSPLWKAGLGPGCWWQCPVGRGGCVLCCPGSLCYECCVFSLEEGHCRVGSRHEGPPEGPREHVTPWAAALAAALRMSTQTRSGARPSSKHPEGAGCCAHGAGRKLRLGCVIAGGHRR